MLELLDNIPGLSQFVFVAMLTPADGRGDGKLVRYERGKRREDVYAFLRERLRWGERDVGYLAGLFADQPYRYVPFAEHFTAETREAYFRRVAAADLRHAVILVDPDNGLQPRSARGAQRQKYVAIGELAAIVDRMADDSVLILYQHFPRAQRVPFLHETARRLRRELPIAGCAAVSPNNQVAFLLLSKSPERDTDVQGFLHAYGARVGLRHCLPAASA